VRATLVRPDREPPKVSEAKQIAAFVAQRASEAPFYYQDSWLDLIAGLYSYRLNRLTTTDAEGRIAGYLPLFLMDSRFTGRRLVGLPFSDHCPLLAADAAAAHRLVDQAISLAVQEGAQYLELRSGADAALAERSDMVASDLYTRWTARLDVGADECWSRLKSPAQRQIKKARRYGVTVRVASEPADVDAYFCLHLRTRSRKHGMPSQPRRYFHSLWDTYGHGGTVRILLAEFEGRAVAGMVFVASGETLRYAYGASDARYLQLGANNLLLWDAIEWGSEQGLRTLDLGRTATDNAGLMAFKSGWGTVAEPLLYYYYPDRAGLAATSERSRKYRALTSVWRNLPLPVAERLGSAVYRHLG